MAEKAKEMQTSDGVQGRSTSVPLSGGYDYEFVEEPTDDMNCSVCLSVLRDPHLTSCCGNHFCQSCITRIKEEGNPCPLCQEKDFSTMLNKSISRRVKDLTIRCPNKSLGCEWAGAIRDVELHLDREDGCGYMAINCDQCCESFTRITLAIHQQQHCPYRPYCCEYCGYKDTMKVIAEDHWPICEECPVSCPNECDLQSLKRKDLDAHVNLNCPLQVVSCDFAGCDAKVIRRDLSAHVMEQQSNHLMLLAANFQQQAKANNVLVAELKGVVRDQAELLHQKEAESNSRIAELEKTVRDQQCTNSANDKRIVKLETVVKQQEEQIRELKLVLERQKNIPEPKVFPPVNLYMEDLFTHFYEEDQWFSEPFYSHPGGYKMCLSVYAAGTGQGSGSHISVFAHIMKGEYDDNLSWPFRGTVTVSLVMDDDDDDIEEDLKFNSRSPAKAARRVDEGKTMNEYGQGLSKFVEWDDVSHLTFLHFYVDNIKCKSM